MLISGILPPEIELRQRLAQFWLRTLATGSYINMEPTQGAVASFCSPQDILNAEIRALSRDRIFKEIAIGGARLEREVPYAFEPWKMRPPIKWSIPLRQDAARCLRQLRQGAPDSKLWIFSDGSCTNTGAGAAALLTQGASDSYFSAARCLLGMHSSTQMELEGVRIGLEVVNFLGDHRTNREVCIVTDSQAAILALKGGRHTSESIVSIYALCWNLIQCGHSITLMWIPGHSDVAENEAADLEARRAAEGHSQAPIAMTPLCKKTLKTRLRAFYTARMMERWKSQYAGQGLRECGWEFRASMHWTTDLSRSAASVVAQFLSDHFPCRRYLHHWALVEDPGCRFCGA